MHSMLVTGPDGRWTPGIGDPTVLGFVTVVAYAVAAFLAAKARSRCSRHRERALAWFWGGIALLLVLLGINKQLDLQTFLIEVARDMARQDGWYEDRRRYQVLFIEVVVVAGAIVAALLARILWPHRKRVATAIVGLCVLGTFVVVRAASFHHVDVLLGGGGVGLNAVLELGGIALLGVSARRESRRSASPT